MIQILAGVGLFFLGVLVGAVFHRSVQGEASKNKRLEQKLAELQEIHTKYQADVSEHFMNTARAVHTLNKSYKDVHEHLAKGASRLCTEEQASDFLGLSILNENKTAIGTGIDIENFTPPMDYAPKAAGDGTLSETFGMTKLSEEQLKTNIFDEKENKPQTLN
tara:strand:+ start:373 stop:861 length:489 start_codon:yes stop_codon:yes gene_type:complete